MTNQGEGALTQKDFLLGASAFHNMPTKGPDSAHSYVRTYLADKLQTELSLFQQKMPDTFIEVLWLGRKNPLHQFHFSPASSH